MKKIAIVTPFSNIGREVVKGLVDNDVELILVGRAGDGSRASDLAPKAKFVAGDLTNVQSLTSAFTGVDSVFWLTPPILSQDSKSWYEDTSRCGAQAMRAAGVQSVVNVSSIGAGFQENLGTISYVGGVEEALNRSVKNVVHLRPGCFMENILLQKSGIEKGTLSFTFDPQHDIPWISTIDIARVAADYLLREDWAGQWSKVLMGPENLTSLELAKRIAQKLGHPVVYRQASNDEMRRSFQAAGYLPVVIQEMLDLFDGLGDPNGIYATPRTADAFTPTTIEGFLEAKFFGEK